MNKTSINKKILSNVKLQLKENDDIDIDMQENMFYDNEGNWDPLYEEYETLECNIENITWDSDDQTLPNEIHSVYVVIDTEDSHGMVRDYINEWLYNKFGEYPADFEIKDEEWDTDTYRITSVIIGVNYADID